MAKVKPVTSVNTWEDRLAAAAAEASSAEDRVSVGSFVSTRGGRLTLNDVPFPNNIMHCIVVGFTSENIYYADNYDPDNPQSPTCYSFFRKEEDAVPHENCVGPQSEACLGCTMNQFGSADRGRGKACKNVRRLALLMLTDMDDIENATPTFLRVPVMSVKNWAMYVKNLATNLKRPPFAVVTEVSVVPDDKSQFRLNFKLAENITDDDQLERLSAKADIVQEMIGFPYLAVEREESPAPKAKLGKVGRK
jgi:hypothetical protein